MPLCEVLRRPELTRKFRGLRGMDVAGILDLLAQAELVEVSATPTVSCDAEDDRVLATALAAGAESLVTEDQDLLMMGECRGVKILDTAAFLEMLEERD